MVRTWVALMFVLVLAPGIVFAQALELTVNTADASVYRSPSVASPVIGQAPRGTRLEVTRDVGDWVKVTWPATPDKVGYVRRSAGVVGQPGASAASAAAPSAPRTAATPPATARAPRAAAAPAPRRAAAPAPAAASAPAASLAAPVPPAAPAPVAPTKAVTSAPQPEVAAQTEPVSPRPQPAVAYVPAPSHTFGIGVLTSGPGMGIGGTARAWAGGRLGVQLDVVRTAMRNDLFGSSLTSTQVGPRVLMALRDRVSDSLWVRPYVGAGARFYRSSVSGLGVGVPTTDNRIGAQMFGGVELSAAGAPRFGLSVDVGYDWLQNPFDQYTLNGVAVAVSGRWYVR